MGMEHTPDIDVSITLNVKDEVGIAFQHAAVQPGKAKLVGIPRRSGGRMVTNEAVCHLLRVDETDGSVGSDFTSTAVSTSRRAASRGRTGFLLTCVWLGEPDF